MEVAVAAARPPLRQVAVAVRAKGVAAHLPPASAVADNLLHLGLDRAAGNVSEAVPSVVVRAK